MKLLLIRMLLFASIIISLANTIAATPEVPVLLYPVGGITTDLSNPLFRWSSPADTSGYTYRIQISKDTMFTGQIVLDSVLSTNQTRAMLSVNTNYFWRVCSVNSGGTSSFSPIDSFTISSTAPRYSDPSFFPFHIGDTWYYACHDTDGLKKTSTNYRHVNKIVDTLAKGVWKLEATNYGDATNSGFETWQYYNGIFTYDNSYGKFYDIYLQKSYYSYVWDLEYDSIGTAMLFGSLHETQTYCYANEGMEPGITKTAKYIGVYSSSFTSGITSQSSSMILSGAIIGGVVYGDTTLTAISGSNNTIAVKKFELQQNYPNPFNPATSIRYEVPETGRVSLHLYGVLGNEVATLVDEDKVAGNYELKINLSNLPSGVYIYKLQQGGIIQSKKLILLK